MNRESATIVDVSWVFPFPRTYRLIRIRNGWLVDKWLPANVLWKLSFEYLIYAIYNNGENTEYIFEMSTKYHKCTNISYLNIACLSCTLTIFFFFFWGQTLQSFARTSKDLPRSPLLHVWPVKLFSENHSKRHSTNRTNGKKLKKKVTLDMSVWSYSLACTLLLIN